MSIFFQEENQNVDSFYQELDSDALDYEEQSTSLKIDVALDSEFTAEKFLSFQFSVRFIYNNKLYKQTFVILDNDLFHLFESELIHQFQVETGALVIFDNLNSDQPILAEYIAHYLFEKINHRDDKLTISVNLFMFYSMRDLTVALSPSFLKPYFLNEKKVLNQRRNISGFLVQEHQLILKNNSKKIETYSFRFDYKIKDLFGLANSSLADLTESCGINTETKKSLDIYKENMLLACKNEPYLFLKYGIFDCEVLFQIVESKINSSNSILSNTFGIYNKNLFYTLENLPITIGSYVYSLWERFLKHNVLKDHTLFWIVIAKQSILDPSYKDYTNAKKALSLLNKIKSFQELKYLSESKSPDYVFIEKYLLNPKAISYYSYQMLSPQYLVENSNDNTLSALSLIQGGRAINERPIEYFFKCVADIDIASAYGNQLLRTILPIGRPRYYVSTNNQKAIKLGDFFNKYESELIPNIYKIVVSGDLSFEQDLIFSKLTDLQHLQKLSNVKKYGSSIEIDDLDDTVPFVLLTKQIKNGIITSHIWDILKKVCSKKEMSEIRNLEVIAAAFYLKKDEVFSIEDVQDEWLKDNGESRYDMPLQTNVDTRTHKWYGLKMSTFISPMLEERKRLKKSKNSIDQALQNSLKLIINTMYGVLCSRFFPNIANVICADNITAATRADVWLMSRALNSFNSITDGGGYCLNNVYHIKETNANIKKPSFEALSNLGRLKYHRSIKMSSLGSFNWIELFEKKEPYTHPQFHLLDGLGFEHIKKFWSFYNININFNIEHKITNLAAKAVSFRKSDYAYLIYNINTMDYTEVFVRLRGVRRSIDYKKNPAYLLLLCMLEEKDEFNSPLIYIEWTPIKLKSWRKQLNNPHDPMTFSGKPGALPGEFYQRERVFSLNNTFIRITNEKLYNQIKNRYKKRKRVINNKLVYDEYIQFFEKFLISEGIKKTYQRMIDNDLRSTSYIKRRKNTSSAGENNSF